MKKVLFSVLVLLLIYSVGGLSVNAQSSAEGEDPTLYDGLSAGEEVVTFTPVDGFDTESKDTVYLSTIGTEYNDPYEQGPDRVLPKFTIVSKRYDGLVYDSWKFSGVSTKSGGVLIDVIERSRTNSYSGTLSVPIRTLNASIGFDVAYSYTRASGYQSQNYPTGNYRLEYRNVFKKHTVTQQETWAGRHMGYTYVYPRQWVEIQYRVVRF